MFSNVARIKFRDVRTMFHDGRIKFRDVVRKSSVIPLYTIDRLNLAVQMWCDLAYIR
jgi:hypothetical protein